MSTLKVMVFSALALGACGGAQTPDLSSYSDKKFADEPLCERAVTNLEDQRFLSTTVPARRKELFNRTEYDVDHKWRVQRCTAHLTERQAACIATAPSLQYVQNCDRYPELQ